MQQSFGKNEIAIGDIWNVSLQFVYLICSFYLFFQMKRPTQTKPTGILFPYVVPSSMKIDGGDEKLFLDSLPWLLHKCFLPVSARLPRLCMSRWHLPGLCPFQCWWSNTINEFPSHSNLKVKYLHQTNCICLATFGNFVTIFFKYLLGCSVSLKNRV